MTLEVFPTWMLYKDYTIPVGSIVAFAGPCTNQSTSPPSGWLVCDGSAVSRNQYNKLFKTIGTTYGSGDGVNTFNLPNLSHSVDSSGTFRPGYIKGTSPTYNSSTKRYSWNSAQLPGTTEDEQFNLDTVTLGVNVNASISEWNPGTAQWQVTLGSADNNAHDHMSGGNASAVPDGYKYTYIDDTDYKTASHDNTSPAGSQYHLIGQDRNHDEWVGKNLGDSVQDAIAKGFQKPYGSYYDRDGKPERFTRQFSDLRVWNHTHRNEYTHTTSDAGSGIIGGIEHNQSNIGENQSTIGSFNAFNGDFYVDGSPALSYTLGSGTASYGDRDGPFDLSSSTNELGGFSTGERYLSLGTFTSNTILERSFTIVLDTRYANIVEFQVIGGNNSNGGERPNNCGEGLYCQINNKRIVQVIPSAQEYVLSGGTSSNWNSIYGQWHTFRLPLSYIDENKENCEFKFFAKTYSQPEFGVNYQRSVISAASLASNASYMTTIGSGCKVYDFRDGPAKTLNINGTGEGNNEWGGFEHPVESGDAGSGNWIRSGDNSKSSTKKYISFGTFESPHVQNREINFKLNTNSTESITFTLIAGNDINGGERPNNESESLFLEIDNPDGGSRDGILLIPSRQKYATDNSGQGKTEEELNNEWDRIYSFWRDYRINLKEDERGPNTNFRIYSVSESTTSWDDELVTASEFSSNIVNATVSFRNAVDFYGLFQISLNNETNYPGININQYKNSVDLYGLRKVTTKYENSVKWYANTTRSVHLVSETQSSQIGSQYLQFELNDGCALYEERRGNNPAPGKNIDPYSKGLGNNEYGGFAITTSGTVRKYIAFGTFNSPYRVQIRSAKFTFNTTTMRKIGVYLIAGNNINGGERPNNVTESLFVKINNGTSYKLIPSRQDTSSWPSWITTEEQWDEYYGQWREYIIEESWFPKQSSCTFEFYTETSQSRVTDYEEIVTSAYDSSWISNDIFKKHRNWHDSYGLCEFSFYNKSGMNVTLNSGTSFKKFRSGPSSNSIVPPEYGISSGTNNSSVVPGEFGGFSLSDVGGSGFEEQEYIMFGNFTSSLESKRKVSLTFDARGAVMIELRVIAGNDVNGGETPNNLTESLYVLVNGTRRMEVIPSIQTFVDESTLDSGVTVEQAQEKWNTLYGNWHSYYIYLTEDEQKENLSVILESNVENTTSEFKTGYNFDPSTSFVNASDTYGFVYGAVHYSTSCLWNFGEETSLVRYSSGPTGTLRGGPNNSNEYAGFSADSLDNNSQSYLMWGIWAPILQSSDGSPLGGTAQPTQPGGSRIISFRANTRRIKRIKFRVRQGNDTNGGENPNDTSEIFRLTTFNSSGTLQLSTEVISSPSDTRYDDWNDYNYSLTGDDREDSILIKLEDYVEPGSFTSGEAYSSSPLEYNPGRNFLLAADTHAVAWMEVTYEESNNFPLPHGTGSEGAHSHSLSFSLNRGHNHVISGQTGSLNISGQDSHIEPNHLPMVYIIHTG